MAWVPSARTCAARSIHIWAFAAGFDGGQITTNGGSGVLREPQAHRAAERGSEQHYGRIGRSCLHVVQSHAPTLRNSARPDAERDLTTPMMCTLDR